LAASGGFCRISGPDFPNPPAMFRALYSDSITLHLINEDNLADLGGVNN
jgi:hypothetical protein